MSLPDFVATLLAKGRTAVPPLDEISSIELSQAGEVLAEFEQSWRQTLPGDAPDFHLQAATWAAAQFYRACQYSVFRDEGPEFAFEPLESKSELRARPETHYSVDLTFRFLPDLVKQVRAAASDDPLGNELLRWAHEWPLSSVGIAGIDASDIRGAILPVVNHKSLLSLYVDRIIEHRDVSRLDDEAVRQAVTVAIGVHDSLAPKLMTALRTHEQAAL
jgi:hypothetical protein